MGEAILFERALAALIAPPGTGKTRAALQIAVAANLGLPFGPLAGHGRPLRWLFLAGNENSRQRYRADLEALLRVLTPTQREAVLDSLHFHLVEDIDDTMTASTVGRIGETVGDTGAGAVVIDPLGDVLTGDANADGDVRSSLRALVQSIRKANPLACILLVHHARTGKQNIVQAVGYDRGNYGKNSKALYAACRSVINMAPGDPDDTSKVVFACGKCNDAAPFPTFGMRLEQGVYVPDPAFDLDAWTADLEGKRTGAKLSVQDIIDFVSTQPGGYASQNQIATEYRVNPSTVTSRVKAGIAGGFLRVLKRKKEKHVFSTGKADPRTDLEDHGSDDESDL
jgi:hypothetical protein